MLNKLIIRTLSYCANRHRSWVRGAHFCQA